MTMALTVNSKIGDNLNRIQKELEKTKKTKGAITMSIVIETALRRAGMWKD